MKTFKLYLTLVESSKSAEKFNITPENSDWIYEIFKKSYEGSTGTAFSKPHFLNRASDWTFFGVPPTSGDDPSSGFVAVRFQRSGLVKLTGVAGNPFSALRGFDLLSSGNYPIWGAVSESIAKMAERKGFKILTPKELLLISSSGIKIPGMEIDSSGKLIANIAEIGSVNKVPIVNQEYVNWLKIMYPNFADKLD